MKLMIIGTGDLLRTVMTVKQSWTTDDVLGPKDGGGELDETYLLGFAAL